MNDRSSLTVGSDYTAGLRSSSYLEQTIHCLYRIVRFINHSESSVTPLAHLVKFIVSAILQWRRQLLFTGIVGGPFTLAVLPYAAFHLDDYFGPCREPWHGLGVAPSWMDHRVQPCTVARA